MTLKHLFALQEALAVLTGVAAGGPGEVCSVAEIRYDEGVMIIDADIRVDALEEKIKGCGGCTRCGCSTTKKTFTEPTAAPSRT